MKILKGREQIGKFKGIPVVANWDYLYKEHGLRKERETVERLLGRIFLLVSGIAVLILFFAEFVNGRILFLEVVDTDRLVEVFFWICFWLFLYSFYLARSRENFIDSIRIKDLLDLRTDIDAGQIPDEIEVNQYFDHDLLNVLDDLLNDDQHQFMTLMIKELAKYPRVQSAMVRIGLDDEKLKVAARKFGRESNAHIDNWIRRILFEPFIEAYRLNLYRVDELALILFILKEPLKEVLLDYEIDAKIIESLELWAKNQADLSRYIRIFNSKSSLKPTNTVNRAFTSRYSPTLVKFSRDFTAEVARGDFTYSIAREAELEELIEFIQEGDSSATLVVGPPGVGRTTLLKSLAVKMVVEDVPDELKDKRLVGFDFNRAYALSPNVDVFKSRVEKVLEETSAAGNIVLVIDDFDQVVSIKKEVATEVINLIINAVDRYKLRIVAVSSDSGYGRKIKPEKALAALFSVMSLQEPSDPVTVQILLDIIPSLEKRYGVRVSFDAVVDLVELSHKFSFEKVLPDKAIDLLHEVMVEAQSQKLQFVDKHLIEEVVTQKVGVKIGAIDQQESNLLTNLEEELHKRLIGQEEAVRAVSAALRRSRAGLTSKNKPIASYLFFGPTGVGKTELAKALTEVYYGDEKLMIRLDMSEYHEEENLPRLIGEETENGFSGGYLTEAVRSRPFSLLLLDEIEKANPKVLDLFLQVLDEGKITDGIGRKIDFTNTIIIATSNVGSKQIADLLAKNVNYEEVQRQVLGGLREFLRVEFLNRFDKVIMFRPLAPIEVEQVAELMMKSEFNKLQDKGINLEYSKDVVNELARLGYNPVYGARELKRVIQEKIEDPIAQFIVSGKLKSGQGIKVESLTDFVIAE